MSPAATQPSTAADIEKFNEDLLIRVSVNLAGTVITKLSESLRPGQTIEEAISEHMSRTIGYSRLDSSPIHLDDEAVKQIRTLLGGKVSTAAKLIDMIERLVSKRIGGYKIKLSPNQQEQLIWMAKSLGRPVDEVAPEIIQQAIENYLQTR